MTLEQVVDGLGDVQALDRVAGPLSSKVSDLVSATKAKDLLSGSWLGHPVHPMLTDVPIGAWTSSVVLDLVGGRSSRKAADRLIALGLMASVPTAAAGLSDWSDYLGAERRIGLVHAGANMAAIGCFTLSLRARRRGHRARGFSLSLLGMATMTAGGYLGGHLSYARGVNVNRNAWGTGPAEWTDVLAEAELSDDKPMMAEAGETDVLLVRSLGRIYAIADRCGHAGAPLHEGSLDGGCVICPWHGSTFRLDDGGVVHGPATVPQPRFDVRVENGRVMVRAALPGRG